MKKAKILLVAALAVALASCGGKKSGGKPKPIAEQRKSDILQYLTDTPEASSTQIADAIGLQVSRTKMYLSELVASGAIVAEGSSRARKYRLKS